MKQKIVCLVGLGIWLASSMICLAEQTIVSHKVAAVITVDGQNLEPEWQEAVAIVVTDKLEDLSISIKSVYTDEEIFFLVTFPDPDESRRHKTWVWNPAQKFYEMGPDREDCFVFKWNMEDRPVDLSVYADNAYLADIWYWKADRTDPVGYADDKFHRLSLEYNEKSAELLSNSGKKTYLLRSGDAGESSYTNTLYVDNEQQEMPHFSHKIPTLSRADVRAKGEWSEGVWALEFSRKLLTGYNDDIQFEPGGRYQFGISRYEIAGRSPDENTSQPLFGAGDTGESLYLTFESSSEKK